MYQQKKPSIKYSIIIIIYVMELGHLLTCSGLTCREASSKVCHGSLTLNLPTTTIVAQPFNIIKWQLKFNPAA
jgi:hypothetical protein